MPSRTPFSHVPVPRGYFLIPPHDLMRTVLSFVFASILFTFATVPVYAQSSSPARKLAKVAEQKSPSDEVVSEYRSLLAGAARYSKSRSSIATALIKGIRDLREHGLSAPVRKLLRIDGLSGLVRWDRPFEEVLDTYLKYRIDRGLRHKQALERMKPR